MARSGDFQFLRQKLENGGRDARVHLKPDHGAEPPAPDGFLDGFQKIVAFQLLNGHFGIARDMERMRFHDFKPGKQSLQIGRDQLLQPDELRGPDGDQLRQRVGNLDAGEAFRALRVANYHAPDSD